MNARFLFLLLTTITSITYAQETKILEDTVARPKENTLQSFLKSSKRGDYIVTQSGKINTLMMVRSITEKSVVLEEISIPVKMRKDQGRWDEWVKNKAPGHSSWSAIELSLENGQILHCYSFSKGAHIQISEKESLIATLLRLPLKPVQPQNRRKIGPPPQEGEFDYRKPWQPPYFFEGKKVDHPEFLVFETIWPSDETEISGRKITLYFDQKMDIPFPCWIDLETSHIVGHFQVIDSGKNLTSPQRTFPKQL